MPFRPPLVPHETFVADPPELHVRQPGEQGLAALTAAEVTSLDTGSVTVKAITTDGETLTVELSAAGEGVIRVKLSQDPDAQSRSARVATLVHPGHFAGATVDVLDNLVRLSAGPVVAELTLNPWHLRFVDATGRLLVEEDAGIVDISGRLRTLPFGRSMVDDGVAAYHESFLAAADEHFVGLGEKFTGLDKRGQRALMWNFDAFGAESDRAYKNVPFYISSRGYGILVDSGMPTEFDICQSTHSVVQILVPDDLIDYYVIAGPTPTDVLARFDALTGEPLMPPKWAFGTWLSSGFFADSEKQALDRARRIRELGIPCDVVHLDCYWQTDGHWSDLLWDPQTFPDPDAMMRELTDAGFKVCLWMNSYISHLSPAFAEADALGLFLKKADGTTYVADTWHGSYPACGILDLTNPAAVEWFTERLRRLLRQGVAAFKTDFAEGVPADSVAHNGMTGVELHNVYSLIFNDLVQNVTREVAGHGLVWARSSFLGGQRHSAQWSGDINATYPAMASTVRAGLSYGLSGVAFWSHDVGGFGGTPTPDLYVRWAQFGALSPLVRFHGTTSRLPWEFPDEARDLAIDALRLRYRLMPYLYSVAVEAAQSGAPWMRAILVDAPEDPAAWHADLEYRIGADLLAAPLTDPSGTRDVYLPEGDWVQWWDGEVRTGGRYARISTALADVPLFVRRGGLIATVEPGDTVGDGAFGPLALLAYDVTDASAVVHDVDGSTTITARRAGDTLELSVSGPRQVTRVQLPRVAGANPPARVCMDGVTVELTSADGVLGADF
jgi:alpha-D-xyloside xylohydrolase